jgi:hypothetical protein
MVVTRTGEDPDHTVTRYVGPTRTTTREGKVYLYDAGTGQIIAELEQAAADAVRDHTPTRLTYDGDHTLTREDTA